MATRAELDLDPDFDAVLARAMCNLGVGPILALLEQAEPPCCRAAASNRLDIRRWAARRQRGGESWSYLDTLDLIDDELARMGASAEQARGCGSCLVCSPPAGGSCGGGTCPPAGPP